MRIKAAVGTSKKCAEKNTYRYNRADAEAETRRRDGSETGMRRYERERKEKNERSSTISKPGTAEQRGDGVKITRA